MILIFLGEANGKGFYHADNLRLLPMGGQVIPLVLARKFQTSLDYISEEGQNCNRSDIKSRFDIMGFSTRDTILGMQVSF